MLTSLQRKQNHFLNKSRTILRDSFHMSLANHSRQFSSVVDGTGAKKHGLENSKGGLVPTGYIDQWISVQTPEIAEHLKWMSQKSLLSQDMFLMGPPGPLKRRLALTMAELCGWEVEYLHLSKDTTESDIKQRREIVGSSSVFVDQGPVRAAIHGRLLILDGMENAERNVLPTLNNLLENREMSLDDGRYLIKEDTYKEIMRGAGADNADGGGSKLVPVHSNFRVMALGCPVPPYAGRTIDPPLRSRFQCRYVDELTPSTLLGNVFTERAGAGDGTATSQQLDTLRRLTQFYQSLVALRSDITTGATGGSSGGGGSSSALSALPVFSLADVQYCYDVAAATPSLPLPAVVNTVIPVISPASGTSLRTLLPAKYAARFDDMVSLLGLGSNTTTLTGSGPGSGGLAAVEDALASEGAGGRVRPVLMSTQRELLLAMELAHRHGRHVCLLGRKGSGKSFLAKELVARLGDSGVIGAGAGRRLLYPLFQEHTVRDLLQRRITVERPVTGADNSAGETISVTGWVDSPLVQAMRVGGVCVLDGIERLDVHVFSSLRRLLQDREVELPSGEKMVTQDVWASLPATVQAVGVEVEDTARVSAIHPDFRIVALGTLPGSVQGGRNQEDCRLRYISSDLGFSYHFISGGDISAGAAARQLVSGCTPQEITALLEAELERKVAASSLVGSGATAEGVDAYRSLLWHHSETLLRGVSALQEAAHPAGDRKRGARKADSSASAAAAGGGGVEYGELVPTLRHVLVMFRHFMQTNAHIMTPPSGKSTPAPSTAVVKTEVMEAISSTFLVPYLPSVVAKRFRASMQEYGLMPSASDGDGAEANSVNFSVPGLFGKPPVVDDAANTLTIGDITVSRPPTASVGAPEKVPHPLYYDNAYHTSQLYRLLRTFRAGDDNSVSKAGECGIPSYLLIGNQGVGKNKVIDRFMELTNSEREYIQLHRDTTIQSLTQIPSLLHGKIVYEDSPLITAARTGRTVVIDEVDKAPLEVVCLIKNLVEDGEVVLHDGRRLVTDAAGRGPSDIAIHPGFKVVCLANRPGFPFLGNNFFHECGDVFGNILIMDNLDRLSEFELLRTYGPDVDPEVLRNIATTFEQLREAYSGGSGVSSGGGGGAINYPFSAREAVAVVRHLQAFPGDSVATAVENILAFDGSNSHLRKTIALIFQRNGLLVPVERVVFEGATDGADSSISQLLKDNTKFISLSTFKDIPAPVTVKVSLRNESTIAGGGAGAMSSETLKKPAPWGGVEKTSVGYALTPCRLFQFSEETARFSLTSPNSSTDRHGYSYMDFGVGSAAAGGEERFIGEVASVATTGRGAAQTLHIVTQNPLTVHSVAGLVPGPSDQPTAPHRVTRHQLLTSGLHRKLYDKLQNSLLVPLGGGDLLLVLPDLSTALHLPATTLSSSGGDGSDVRGIPLPFLTQYTRTQGQGRGRTSHNSKRSPSTEVTRSFMNRLLGVGGTMDDSPYKVELGGGDVEEAGLTERIQGLRRRVCVAAADTADPLLLWGRAGMPACAHVAEGFLSLSRSERVEWAAQRGPEVGAMTVHILSAAQLAGTEPPVARSITLRPGEMEYMCDLPGPFAMLDVQSISHLEGERWLCNIALTNFECGVDTVAITLTVPPFGVGKEPTFGEGVTSSVNAANSFQYQVQHGSGFGSDSGSTGEAVVAGRANEFTHGHTRTAPATGMQEWHIWPREVTEEQASAGPVGVLVNSLLPRSMQMDAVAGAPIVVSSHTAATGAVTTAVAVLESKNQYGNFSYALEVSDLSARSPEGNFRPRAKTVPLNSMSKYENSLSSIPSYVTDKATVDKARASAVEISHSAVAGSALLGSTAAVVHRNGTVRLFDTDEAELQRKLGQWKSLLGHNKQAPGALGKLGDKAGLDLTDKERIQQLLEKLESPPSKPRTEANMPKHGKDDDKAHVGGNTWAGGSGGSDTAGLGGRGGPYRLDKGHKTHQISDEEKAKISAESKAAAEKMGKEALAKHLKGISMGQSEYKMYLEYKGRVETQITTLKQLFEEMNRRAQERVWLRHQQVGDLDDTKLIDGLTGDRMIFKRRGAPPSQDGMPNLGNNNSGGEVIRKRLQFIMDVSGSMYRFNGEDKRLERLIESTLMVMESLSGGDGVDGSGSGSGSAGGSEFNSIEYSIIGHSGDNHSIPFIGFDDTRWDERTVRNTTGMRSSDYVEYLAQIQAGKSAGSGQGAHTGGGGNLFPPPVDEADRMNVLSKMVAHSQYCMSGDNTLKATEQAINRAMDEEAGVGNGAGAEVTTENYIVVVSDANFARYGISPHRLGSVMTRHQHAASPPAVHFVFLASMDGEAQQIVKELPVGHGHVCLQTQDLPNILKDILSGAMQ